MKIDHIAMYVKDLEGARAFFATYFHAQSGEVYCNPKTGFRSYFLIFGDGARLELMTRPGMDDPEKTASVFHPEHPNWATFGDVGYLDEDRFLYLTDRKAFTIISGGVNIYPQEIENALVLHPAVDDVAVIGLPDEEMGERVHAVVVAAEGQEPGPALAEEILGALRGTISDFKLPRGLDFVDELPRTPTGKLVKRRIVQQYA